MKNTSTETLRSGPFYFPAERLVAHSVALELVAAIRRVSERWPGGLKQQARISRAGRC